MRALIPCCSAWQSGWKGWLGLCTRGIGYHSDMFFRWSWKHSDRERDRGECTTFWLCIDRVLIAATENVHGTAGGLNALIPGVGRALYFTPTNGRPVPHHPQSSNHCQLPAPGTMAAPVRLTFLLGIPEIDGMPALRIFRGLKPLSSFSASKHNLWKPDLLFWAAMGHILEISASSTGRIQKPAQ